MGRAGTLKIEAWDPQNGPPRRQNGSRELQNEALERQDGPRVSQWLSRWAMAGQLAAQSAPESEFDCLWEPPGLILDTLGVLFGRIWRPF